MTVIDNLSMLDSQEIQNNNIIKNFLPYRSQTSSLDYEAIAGSVLVAVFKKQLRRGTTLDSFEAKVIEQLKYKLSDQSILPLINKMYFCGDSAGLLKVTPEFLIFKSSQVENSIDKHASQILISFINNSSNKFNWLENKVNFLECEFVKEFQKNLVDYHGDDNNYPYLPFVAKLFCEDLSFILMYPGYFLENLKSFFNLYIFLYSSQLALNINEWTNEPESKPLFFILDTEKASLERKQVRETYKFLRAKSFDLFPILSMLEYLNQPQDKSAKKFPLWKIYLDIECIDNSQAVQLKTSLKRFCERYREKRNIEAIEVYPETSKELLDQLSQTAKTIFMKKGTSQYTVNSKYVNVFENKIASHFVQSRGRAGKILTLSQDYLLLLTNIAIGNKDKIQFQKLMHNFKERGVWLDKQSEKTIIKFYERIGNIERMSDSGDAVYVRKTL